MQLYLHTMFRKIEVVYLCVKHHTILISVWNIYLFSASYVILSIKYVVLRAIENPGRESYADTFCILETCLVSPVLFVQ